MSLLTRRSPDVLRDSESRAPLISLRDVEKSHKAGGGVTYVLRRVTLDIAAGEFVTVMGPSGAGKSTLLAILGMLDPAFSGEYLFGGRPVHLMDVRTRQAFAREQIGFVFQQYHLLDDLTVAENAPSWPSRRSSSRTSPRATSTRRRRARSWNCSRG